MVGAVSWNLGYAYGVRPSGATLGAARTAMATGNGSSPVAPAAAVPEVYSNENTTRVPRTPAQAEQARQEAYETMKGSAFRSADRLNAPFAFSGTHPKEAAVGNSAAADAAQARELSLPGTQDRSEEEYSLPGMNDDSKKKPGRASSPEECETCKRRTYVDGSNESDVSFKTPGHISPEASAAVVSAHERQHVSNAVQEGSKPGAKLVSATVTLKTAVCPECGTTYVAGGVTHTMMRYTKENPYAKEQADFAAFRAGKQKNGVDLAA